MHAKGEVGATRRVAVVVLGAALLLLGSGIRVASAAERVDVLIGFTHRPGQAEQAQVRREGGVISHSYRLVSAIAASVPERAIERLRAQRNVTYVEPDGVFHAVDAELDDTWGVKRIGAGTVHDAGQKGLGVKVGVIDSGIDTDHLDLTWDPSCSYDFVGGDTFPEDGNGHGTHTAGTVAALANGTGVVGAAPAAILCVYRVLNDSGSGSYSNVIAALDRAVLDGVQVTNNSYGSSGDPGATVKAAFDNAYAAGVLHAGAAGNSGNPRGKGENCIYPALYDTVIATAATTSSDARASFSSTCPELELAAPGHNINSTVPGGGYDTYSGTSMASPHVAGTAALVIGATGWGNATVRQRLQDTAQDLGSTGRDSHYGFGLVRADLAVPSAPPTTGSISGTVTDAGNGAAIAGATVSVGTGESTTTASNGIYTITGVPIGDRSVTASADGFGSQTTTATVNQDQTTVVDFALNATTTASTVTVGSITYSTNGGPGGDKHLNSHVLVVDDAGNPVEGASVAIDLYREGSFVGSGTGTSDASGTATFSLKNAASGCYTTTVTDVTASGSTWDGISPTNVFCK